MKTGTTKPYALQYCQLTQISQNQALSCSTRGNWLQIKLLALDGDDHLVQVTSGTWFKTTEMNLDSLVLAFTWHLCVLNSEN